MKIALLLCGHLRTYEKTFTSLSQYIPNFDTLDIFIHTWNKISSNKEDKINLNHIKKIYNIKDCIIEDQSEIVLDNIYSSNEIKGQKYQYISFYKSNLLKKSYEDKHNFKYDLVIKLRPDCLLKQILNVNKIINTEVIYLFGRLENNSNNYLYPSCNKSFQITYENKISALNVRAFDILIIANSKNMDFISKIGTEIYDQYENINILNMKKGLKFKSTPWGLKNSHFVDYLIDNKKNMVISNYNYPNDFILLR